MNTIGSQSDTHYSRGTTIGREFHTGKMIPAGVLDGLSFVDWPQAVSDPTRFKLVFLQTGNALLTINGQQTTVIAPAVVFVPHAADASMTLTAVEPDDKLILFHPQYIFDTLTLDFDFSRSRDPDLSHDGYLLYRFDPTRRPVERTLFLEPGVNRFLRDAAVRMKHELDTQPDWAWPCRARSFLLEILITCTRLQETQAGLFSAAGALITEAGLDGLYGYLIARLREKLTVDKIAASFRTNRTSLQEKVRRATGLSVTQYLIRLRVQTASVLLRNTSLPIAEIMERTGFVDESHFSRSFKRYAERSPSDFRKAFVIPQYVK